MRYSIILALATAASAIDIEWFGESHCRNGYGLRCQNINPNTCCSGQRSGGWAAVQFANIPNNWDVVSDAYDTENCRTLVNEFRSNGNSFVCHGDNRHYKSAGYHFFSKKRSTYIDTRDASSKECVKPDTLFLADGTTYAISGLTDDQVAEFITLAENATHTDLPAVYQALRVE
ncbi:hypothetical protein COCSADRAFT_193443 [Bipolaris sorokiniana ND90Pr]|uniref:Uncharacterized protein n=1 Tax=Cochliobolus sativus (strain ND90Pr / ATCC 201652) TaxID=665912 RepID=M2SS98_COCSN|nr:uncharacterized protein COCSADRAFT_193443 [Bipolaris sorokiniana ND90Pr]EMD59961.1 hypothetical protein COCSADRAFT_193443 [Bipolaris sorokiniana ND90Pr]